VSPSILETIDVGDADRHVVVLRTLDGVIRDELRTEGFPGARLSVDENVVRRVPARGRFDCVREIRQFVIAADNPVAVREV